MKITSQQKEYNAIFDSLQPTLENKIVEIDFTLRQISREAQTSGVSLEVINEGIKERFWSLFSEMMLTVAKGEKPVNPAKHTPIPRRDETPQANGEVISYTLTPEQMEAELAKYGNRLKPPEKRKAPYAIPINLQGGRRGKR